MPWIRWLSNDRLQITFSATQGARGIKELKLKGFANKGQIWMVYKVRD
jgi:hypothetical protein